MSTASQSAARSSQVIVTVTGPDRPGITARFTGILSEMGALLLDIEQVVVREHLSLGMLIDIEDGRGVLKELLFAAKELGLSLDFHAVDERAAGSARAQRYVVTAIGKRLGAGEMHALSTAMAEHGGNIAKISRLSHGALG